MSYKHVYIPVCSTCNKEGPYNWEKKIPEQWVGFLQDGRTELKYVYGKDGWSSLDGKTRTTSSSCYIPEDSVFCSFKCFSTFINERIESTKNAMSKQESTIS